MSQHAQTIATVISCASGLVLLGGVAVRRVVKPLNRMADRVESAVKVVEGTPAQVVNGFTIVERRPGVVEQFDRVERGVAGLYPRVETLERLLGGQR
jgi:hypothetical protein